MPSKNGEISFLAKHRWAAMILVVLAAWLVGHHYWVRWISGTVVYEPISLSPPSSFEKNIIVRKPEIFRPELIFSIGDTSREEMRRLLGESAIGRDGKPYNPGIAVPLRWSIMSSGSVVASTETASFGTTGHSADAYYRAAGPNITLAPGAYRFQFEIVRDVPELRFLQTRFWFRRSPKGIVSWHDDVIIWGNFLNFYLITPITALLAFYLLARYLYGAWSARRRT